MKEYPPLRVGRIAIVGPFPPPLHGAAAITAAMAGLLIRRMQVIRCDNSPGTLLRSWSYHVKRIWRLFSALVTLMGMPGQASAVYVTAAGGFGLFYDLICILAGRLKGCSVFVHHHSFAYIDRRSAAMALLVRASGARALHIALCDRMAGLLRDGYGIATTQTLSNIAFYPPRQTTRSMPSDVMRLGHMSNLCDDKGLDLVFALYRAAKAAGLPVRLVLAGPAADAAAEGAISAARREFKDGCDYRGPVYGDAKEQFFADVDVFLFPTRYVNEAQPTVLFEAMSHGVPSIAIDRGCIVEQLGGKEDANRAGMVISRPESFVEEAMAILKNWSLSAGSFVTAKEGTRKRADFLYATAAAQLEALLTRIEEGTMAR